MPYAGIPRNSRGSPQTLRVTGTTGLPPRPSSSDGWPALALLISPQPYRVSLSFGTGHPSLRSPFTIVPGSVITSGRGGRKNAP